MNIILQNFINVGFWHFPSVHSTVPQGSIHFCIRYCFSHGLYCSVY